MVWTEQKDLSLLKEIAAEGVLTTKEKSRERGSGWQTVAENLCPVFKADLTSSSVRDPLLHIGQETKSKAGQRGKSNR